MGNSATRLSKCCYSAAGDISRRHDMAMILTEPPLDDGLGHSFCYIRPDPYRLSSSKIHSEFESTSTSASNSNSNSSSTQTTSFISISGASVSANASSPLSTTLNEAVTYSTILDKASSFESSTLFASLPLQPVPRSGNLVGASGSGPLERGFLSGPIERGFTSGPIDRGPFSGSIDQKGVDHSKLQRSLSHGEYNLIRPKRKRHNLVRAFGRAFSKTIAKGGHNHNTNNNSSNSNNNKFIHDVASNDRRGSSDIIHNDACLNYGDGDGGFVGENESVQWAQGKAGEDRMHIVVSEENGWVFVGIYDGFNGPDAPDYLLSNLYCAVEKELKGLLWNERAEFCSTSLCEDYPANSVDKFDRAEVQDGMKNNDKENCAMDNSYLRGGSMPDYRGQGGKKLGSRSKKGEKKDSKEKRNESRSDCDGKLQHLHVLKALSRALKKTEDAYLELADKMVMENPELALMGSCVLVMLMKGDDVYLMNVGDSRAVIARKAEADIGMRKFNRGIERINEESIPGNEIYDGDEFDGFNSLASIQLTRDHSTYIEEEVRKIKNAHPDDPSAIMNDRVKGYLKVTRAFGAGFLKKPKWNDALLEMFRIDYVGVSPYITCFPSLCHYRLGPRDMFILLSSDGLNQYFTNQEAVSEIESFLASFPEGDPAQHLIEEVLFRAAKRAGMDFHELLEIPQGDRRRYHDDVSIIIISLEGRIWRSSM